MAETAAERVGLGEAEADLVGLAEPVLLADEDAVLLTLALPVAVRLDVVVREELVEPEGVLLPVALSEKKELDVGVLELILVRVLVLVEVVVMVARPVTTESCDFTADFVAVVVLDADRDDDAVMVGRTLITSNLRPVSLPS